MTRPTPLLVLAASFALGGGCSKPPAFPPEMTCEALEAERQDAERKVRALAGDTVDLDQRDLMGDVHARSNQGDEEWRQAKQLREAHEHLQAVKAAIADRCPSSSDPLDPADPDTREGWLLSPGPTAVKGTTVGSRRSDVWGIR